MPLQDDLSPLENVDYDGTEYNVITISDDVPEESMEQNEQCEPPKKWPEQSRYSSWRGWLGGIFSSWSYSYMNPILAKGKKQFKEGYHFRQSDLYEVPDDLRSSQLVEQFRKDLNESKSLVRSLWLLVAPVYIPAGVWQFLYVVSRVTLPLSLRRLLVVLEKHPLQAVVSEGLPYAITLSLAALLSALAQNRMIYLSTKSGIMLRAALSSAIYEHALGLTPVGRAGLTTGEVTNLVAVDTQKLFDVMLEGHNLWSCPLLISIVTILLATLIGPAMTIGVAILILFLPVVQAIVSRMLRIRRERAKLTDVRINIISSMLQGIRVTKLNHYEQKLDHHIGLVRDQEMQLLKKELAMWGWVLTAAVSTPIIATASAFAFYALVNTNNIIIPADAFSALLLFSILRFPVNLTARLIGKTAQAVEAVRRIGAFLKRESRPFAEVSNLKSDAVGTSTKPLIEMRNAKFTIQPRDECFPSRAETESYMHHKSPEAEHTPVLLPSSFTVQDLSIQLYRGSVIAIVGKVGSGKTTLLRAILGEIPTDKAQVHVRGSMSYAAQEAFILNTSLRDNILFGSELDKMRYERALDACCLHQDIEQLGSAGDLTQIGERGVTLSGGQKQRVALARAVYAETDLVLLDDVFSALDASTANAVFEGLFGLPDGQLRSRGTLLVTHATQFLPHVDKILIMSDGTPSFLGSWAELQVKQGINGKSIEDLGALDTDIHRGSVMRKQNLNSNVTSEKDGIIMTIEEREYGVASLKVWIRWIHYAGGWYFALAQVIFLSLDRGFYVASDWWIAIWSNAAYEPTEQLGVTFDPQVQGRAAQSKFVLVYASIILISAVAAIFRSQWALAGGAKCAEHMFTGMTKSVLHAKMSYFETTPLGRILNRFTYDVEVLDVELPVAMTGLMISFSWLLASVVVMITVLPWIILGLIPISGAYVVIQHFYRMSGPDLQRLDAISRSPVQAALAEGLEGASTIRAYRKEKQFSTIFRSHVDKNSAAMLNFLAAQRWLILRIECLGAAICFMITVIIVCANDTLKIKAGQVGLVVQWSVVFSAALNFFFLRLTESEARITSVERVHTMAHLPQEADWESESSMLPDPTWPSRGELEFDSVSMRYRKDLPLALERVSFKLLPGMRCGVIGRTGSGKTSLTVALFRLVELDAGRILLDGVDLSKLGLSDVRGRSNGLRIIPQDPVLFAGTLRNSLDPFQNESDEKILEALKAVEHKGVKERGMAVLSDSVDEGGANFSVGERQLLCLARAIVEEPRVLILDEATASVDKSTDRIIQEMLRTRFRNTTLLTIAHRLDTVMDYDRVLVMQNGTCVEFDSPDNLLKNPSSTFSSFVDATGPVNAAELRRKARQSKMNKA